MGTIQSGGGPGGEKEKDTLPYGPMDEIRLKQMLIQRLEG
jgi:hypothetical protein